MDDLNEPLTVTGILARLADEYWWRRALRKVYGRKFEHGAIRLGLVHSRKGKYVSDETLTRRQKRDRRNRAILEHCIATNETGTGIYPTAIGRSFRIESEDSPCGIDDPHCRV